jgi:RNA polymerase sigma-70 factor, ECF subfamily
LRSEVPNATDRSRVVTIKEWPAVWDRTRREMPRTSPFSGACHKYGKELGRSGHIPGVVERVPEEGLLPSDGDDERFRHRFELLYKEHFQAVYAYCLRRVPTDEVSDLVAEIFTTAWRRMANLPPPPEDRLWLYGTARRTVSQNHRGHFRAERTLASLRQSLSSATSTASNGTSTSSARESRVIELVDHLRPKDRELVRLIVWEQLSHSEVARVLGCSTNAVGIRWHRSLRRLRRDLGEGAELLPLTPDPDFPHPRMGDL